MEARSIQARAYTAMFAGLLGFFALGSLLTFILPPVCFGLSRFVLLCVIVGVAWFLFLRKFIPRCPNCGLGVLSYIEIAKIPVFMRSWVGSHCSRCGEALKWRNLTSTASAPLRGRTSKPLHGFAAAAVGVIHTWERYAPNSNIGFIINLQQRLHDICMVCTPQRIQ